MALNINISFQQLLDAVKQLSPDEKLQLNEVLWNDEMPIPEEHQKIVLERLTHYRETKEAEDFEQTIDDIEKSL